ncbi:MAG: UvrD-helicase domain-containing protein [Endomicrobium sp.]|jgi:ATP-dependent exoDNAse (exonuclease V) beta subunit|nr:UvrD-helicase domain-containing protein [Endomicrobium sp.]
MEKFQIISVQASAGSGKTYSLAKRYLYLLLDQNNDAEVKNIVAVTFTNKAAIEMKYRIINYLKKAALLLDADNFFCGLKLTKNEIAKRSITILNSVFESHDNFNIGTIDSFKNYILKSCAINIDLSPNFNIEQDYSDNLLFALSIFLKKSQTLESLRKIILRYLSQYLIKDLGWFPRENIYNEIEKLFKLLSNTGKNIKVYEDIDFKNEIFLRSKLILGKIIKFSEIFSELKINSHYVKAIGNILKGGVTALASLDIPIRFAYKNLGYKKGAEINTRANKLWNVINIEIQSLCDFYMMNYYSVYSNMYSNIILEFDKQSKKEGIVFLNEINKKTVRFFEENNNIIPEIYYRLSEKYKHFLIDEFQDTSLVQWIGIKRLLEEGLACGGTFFYVGDAKQAIYSFRGGKSEIFNTVLQEFPIKNIDRRYLMENFRSGKIIVDFNNNIFSKENIERFLSEIYKSKYIKYKCYFEKFIETYSSPKQEVHEKHNYGYVEINIMDKNCKNDVEKIKQKFISYILDILNRFNLDDIAVLCRTNDEVLVVSTWLLENKFDVESSQTLNIKNNKFIKQVVSLMKFINSPIDTLSFFSFVIGDIFTTITKINVSEFERFFFIYNNENRSEYFCKAFREKYKDLWNEYFEYFFEKAGLTPVYELVLAILDKFKVINNFPNIKVFIMRFLELIKDFEIEYSGLRNFLEYFDNLKDDVYIKDAFCSGIKVMTVHKAKGLQFPVVIISSLKLSEKNIKNPYFDDSSDDIELLRLSGKITKFSQKAKEIYDSEKINLLLSELNILYVSMTRARYEFYAIVPTNKSTNSNNLILKLIHNTSLISGTKYNDDYVDSVLKNDIILDAHFGGYKDIQMYLKSVKKTIIDVNNIRQKGLIVHYALSKIVSLKNKDINKSVDYALRFTKRRFLFENVEFIREKLKKLFASKEVLDLFLFDSNNIHNEKEIANSSGEIFRIDKLIINKNMIIIVDFKSSNHSDIKNENQLKLYSSIISEIYPSKVVSACIVNVEKFSIQNWFNFKC